MTSVQILRAIHTLRVSIAGFMILVVAAIASAAPAHAEPVTPHVSAVVMQAIVPSSQAPTPVSSHCGAYASWTKVLDKHDTRLRFRVWYYTDADKTRWYCVKIYKMKKNKTVISLDAFNIYGDRPHRSTKGSSVYVVISTPKGWTAFANAHYGKVDYTPLYLYND